MESRPIKYARLEQVTQLLPSDQEITEKDLPLLANVDQVKVHHYLNKMKTDFNRKVIKGTLVLFLEWVDQGPNRSNKEPHIVLDSCFLNIQHVYCVQTNLEYDAVNNLLQFNARTGSRKHFYKSNTNIDWFANNGTLKELNFTMQKWSTTISGWENTPSVIRIDYETLETSPSLHWRPCNGIMYGENCASHIGSANTCCYTPAPPVNNRGLFPCQEPPSAMATWEVLMEVENFFTPLLASDEPGEIVSIGKTASVHYFFTSIPLPIATFAMVVGQFTLQTSLSPPDDLKRPNNSTDFGPDILDNLCQDHTKYPCRFGTSKKSQEIIPVRLFSLDSDCISSLDLDKFRSFVYCSLKTCWESFGPHPFDRLDLVIMPKWYPHMGLANPSMSFLSPCIFKGNNEPQFVRRIPHEICHSWFGLLIGALDWTEEWLSEGFATFCEHIIFKKTYQSYFSCKSEEEVANELGLGTCLLLISLQQELKNTSSNNELHVISKEKTDDNNHAAKDGLVPLKQFMNVHYNKGYLLLWYLSFTVGEENFVKFLKEYIQKYHGQLVTSDIFLGSFHEKFNSGLCAGAQNKSNFIKKTREVWLESETLPSPFDFDAVKLINDITDVRLYPLLKTAFGPINKVRNILEKLKQKKLGLGDPDLETLTSSELTLLFELILAMDNEGHIKANYDQLAVAGEISVLDNEKQNPDVMHKWCELIVLCKDVSRLSVVKQFLDDNMAMGVYLYGELMITENIQFQKLATDMYHKLESLYDMNTKRLLTEMLF